MSDIRRQRQAAVVLVVVTLLWGISFSWTRHWMDSPIRCPGGSVFADALAALTLISLRMILALILLAVWHRRGFTVATRREHLYGALVGVVFGAGFVMQTIGMATTLPAETAFFTSLASAWTPLFGWMLLGTRVRLLSLLGLGVAIGGTAIMSDKGWQLSVGACLIIAASVLFAGQILLVDQLGRQVRASFLTVGFFAAVAMLTIAGAIPLMVRAGFEIYLTWLRQMLADHEMLLTVFGLAILPTTLGFHLMNIYQPRVPAYRAALIYLLEPVFAGFFSVCLGYEHVTVSLLLGGSLILAGNLLVELPAIISPGATAKQ